MTRSVLALVLSSGLLWQAPPRTTFRSTTDAVLVDVSVTDGGRPVSGLGAEHFQLLDSGVIQEIRAASIETLPVTVLLALDTSDSTEGAMIGHLKAAARAAVGALRAQDQAGVISFSARVELHGSLTSDHQRLRHAIDALEPTGATAMYDAIFTAVALAERAAGRVLLLVCTDGLDTASWLNAKAVLEAALRSDIVVYGVSAAPVFVANGPGEALVTQRRRFVLRRWFEREPDMFPQGLLEEITERTGGELLFVKDGAELAPVFAEAVARFRSRYVLSYVPQNVPAGGWHPIEVRLKNRRGAVQARRGYWR